MKIGEKILGRAIKEFHEFKEPGTLQSMYAAERWITNNGYSSGSTSCYNPVAIVKGKYNLPQKWYNIPDEEKKTIAGIMDSSDWREGMVRVIIFL